MYRRQAYLFLNIYFFIKKFRLGIKWVCKKYLNRLKICKKWRFLINQMYSNQQHREVISFSSIFCPQCIKYFHNNFKLEWLHKEISYLTLSSHVKNLWVLAVGAKQVAAVSSAQSAAIKTTNAYIVQFV